MNRFIVSALLLGSLACSREKAPPRTAITTADTGAPMAGMAHGNHNPKYGGVVLMRDELHFEVVAKPDGAVTVYFSDAARQELPASAVSNVSVGIKRSGFRAEHVDMKINDSGESWVGKGGYVDDKDKEAELEISFTYQGKPLSADMPYFAADAQKESAKQP